MKKFIVLSALVAVASTAFVACSSDDDLAQQPKAPETIVENSSSKGTPFSVNPSSGATRAARYGASAWNGTSKLGQPWVREFKLYGNQGTNEPWMNNVVFQRTSYTSTSWSPVRDATGSISEVSWPADNPATTDVVESAAATNFYAITDNAIDGTKSDALANVSSWMAPTVGQFDYLMPTATKANMEWIDVSTGNGVYETASTAYVDSTKIKDLMVASASTNEAGTSGGVLNLAFTHVLAGLTVKAKFLSNLSAGQSNFVTISYIKICGLKTSGTYTFGSGWGNLDDYVVYYKEWTGDDKPVLYAQAEGTTAESTPALVIEELVCPGEWLAIPQSTTPWDASYMDSDAAAPGVAYVAVRLVDDKTGDDLELWYPLNITLTAAKNKVLIIDLGQFFEPYDSEDNVNAVHYYKPTSVLPTT